MKNIEITKKLLALISTATITLTVSSCGQSGKKIDNSGTTTSIIYETGDSDTTMSNATTSTGNTDTPSSGTLSQGYTTQTTTTVTPTILQTIDTTSSSTTKTFESSKLTASKPTTSTNTTRPKSSGTTTRPSEPQVKKLTTSNINDVSAIDAIANDAQKYVYHADVEALYLYIAYTYNGITYYCEKDEFRLFISLLNIESMDSETLIEMFGGMTNDDIIRCSRVFAALSNAVCKKNVTINYDQIIVDNNIRLFLNELQSQVIKYKKQGNIDEYNQYVEDYFNGKNKYVKYGENPIIDNYVYTLCGQTINLYDNVYLDFIVSTNTRCSSEYNKYIKNDFYNKTRAKQLVKE